MIASVLVVTLGETFSVMGHIFFKKSTNKLTVPELKNLPSYLSFAKTVLCLPGIWLGLASMVAGLIIWMFALSAFELSLVFPISSVQYVVVLIASRLFLREKIDFMKVFGTSLIIAGIVITTISSS